MGVGLSLEVNIPHAAQQAVLELGRKLCPMSDTSEMELAEAVQWTFFHPSGPAQLANLGVTWDTVHTGVVIHNQEGTKCIG